MKHLSGALTALAIAIGISGVMFAVAGADDARHSSPEYWHYMHHRHSLTPSCNKDCTFTKTSVDLKKLEKE